jgi:O-methyltransferase
MKKKLKRVPATLAKLPYLIVFVCSSEIGREYSLGLIAKLRLVAAFRRNNRRVETLSTIVEHLELASALLRIPSSTPGIVVECGCYKGGSTINVSLVCAIVGRQLMVCDSFQGLPEISKEDRRHVSPIHAEKGNDEAYQKGDFAVSRELVESNLRSYGRLDLCRFTVGYFEESMVNLDEPVAMAFLDVDLIESLNPCLEAIWPRLAPGGRVYVHEADDLALVARFFDRDWWTEKVRSEAPGFVGGGSGLPLAGVIGSSLGYAEKDRVAGVPVDV